MTVREATTARAVGREVVRIRAMTLRDIRAASAIERAAYGALAPQTEFRRELANGLAQYIVAERGAESLATAAGSIVASPRVGCARLRGLRRLLLRGWPWRGANNGTVLVGLAGVWFTRDQLHLVTLAVAPAWQRRGVAARLMLCCVELAEEAELGSIALEVRPANAAARALYERFGLREVGRLRGYYLDTDDDAVLMLSPPLDDPAFLDRIDGLRAALRDDAGARDGISEGICESEERAGSSGGGCGGEERR